MAPLAYLDFKLEIEQMDRRQYRARVIESPAGNAVHFFEEPAFDASVDDLIQSLGRRDNATSNGQAMASARVLGAKMFHSVFADEVLACFRTSEVQARSQPDTGLRIKLHLGNAPTLAGLPWELLFDTSRNLFLAHDRATPVVRYLDVAQFREPGLLDGPLEILVMISNPRGVAALDVQRERALIDQALARLVSQGRVAITYLERATPRALRHALRDASFDIFHYIGHGTFDQNAQQGGLMLENEDGLAQWVGGQQVGTTLRNARSLRLVVLNACDGARNARNDPYSSVATTLLQQGMPAIIAMQFPITDAAACLFADELYHAVVDGLPIDAALVEARQALYTDTNHADVEWSTPVLYMSAQTGALADVVAESSESPTPTTPVPRPPVVANPQEFEDRLVEALLACRAMIERATRDMVIARVPREISVNINRSAQSRADMVWIVKTCMAYPGGLRALHDAVLYFEGGSFSMSTVTELVERWPGDERK